MCVRMKVEWEGVSGHNTVPERTGCPEYQQGRERERESGYQISAVSLCSVFPLPGSNPTSIKNVPRKIE